MYNRYPIILVLGDKAVGKSSFLHFIAKGEYLDSYTPTTEMSSILLNDMLFVETTETINSPIDGVLVFCNVDDSSYHYASQQIRNLRDIYPKIPMILVVNDKYSNVNNVERNKYFMDTVLEYLRFYSVQTHLICVQTGVGCWEIINALRLLL